MDITRKEKPSLSKIPGDHISGEDLVFELRTIMRRVKEEKVPVRRHV